MGTRRRTQVRGGSHGDAAQRDRGEQRGERHGGGDTGVTLENALVAGNTVGNVDHEASCDHSHDGAGVNMEFPGDPSSPCTQSVIVADPMLGSLKNNGGVTDTLAPAAKSPAIGKGTGCPLTDQRGLPRKSARTLGAYEVE